MTVDEQRLREVLTAESEARLAWQRAKLRAYRRRRGETGVTDTAAWRLATADTIDLEAEYERAKVERQTFMWSSGVKQLVGDTNSL